MAKGVRIVDSRNVVQDVDTLMIAYNGLTRLVESGFVAQSNIIRQFWPSDTIDAAPIVLSTLTEETYDVSDTAAEAFCTYDARTGRVILSSKSIQAVNPAPRAQGLFLWRLDVVSGNIVGDTGSEAIGTWEDVNSDGTLGTKKYVLRRSTVGSEAGQATVSVAEDNGAGAPLAGTVVSMTVNFTAEVVDDRITMTSQPWTLSNTEINEKAEVFIVTVPEGWWDEVNQYTVVESFITGEFGYPKGIQISEIYSANWGTDVTVQVDEVSGTLLGDATGVALSTATKRVWYIEADTVGTVEAVADVTITDGVQTATKRINMTAEQVSEANDPGSEVSADFTRYDEIIDTNTVPINTAGSARMTITMKPDGYFYSVGANVGTPAGFPQMWQSQAPAPTDAQNYECRMTKISGDDFHQIGSQSSAVGVWLNCAGEYDWVMTANFAINPNPRSAIDSGVYRLEVQEVGRPETVKIKTFTIEAYVESN